MTKSSAAYEQWAQEQAREEANSYHNYLDYLRQEEECRIHQRVPEPETSGEINHAVVAAQSQSK